MNDYFRPALLFALLPLACACSQAAAGQDLAREAERARLEAEATQRTLAALPPVCTLGAPGLGAHGTWLNTTKAEPGPGPEIANVFGFDKAVTARVLRIALNRQALKDLEKVETRDATGQWKEAGPIAHRDAPTGCEYVWLVQELPEARELDGLRYSFRREPGTITAANPGVLQDSAAR